MALSIVSIPGDGVTDTFTVSFALGFLDRSSITAWVTGEYDGGGNKTYRTITFLTDTMLKISGAKAGMGVPVVFTRTVSDNQLVVNYEDGDIMNEENLNTAQKQALMLVHQVLDGRFSGFIQDVSAGGYRITNLGAPVNASDAASKAYVDANIATGSANAAISAAAAVTATGAAGTATTQAGIATTGAGTATTQAGLASGYRSDSLTYSNNASASAILAQAWANNAEDVVVPGFPGQYSARHWAAKAAAVVGGNIGPVIAAVASKATLLDADKFAVSDSAATDALKHHTWAQLKASILSYFNASLKATPVAADRIWIGDSAASFIPKYLTFTNLNAYLAGIYAPTTAVTTTVNGLMIAADKVKLNAVGTMANRAVTISTSAPSGGADGDVWLQV